MSQIMTAAHIRIRGVSFANNKDKPDAMYALKVINTKNGVESSLHKFKYSESKNLKFKICTHVESKQNQSFKICIYKVKMFSNQLIATCIVPFSAFPDNNVCQEKLMCNMEDKKLVPMSVIFDMHVDNVAGVTYDSQKGRSNLAFFDSNDYYNLHLANQNQTTDETRGSPLLM